MSGAAKEGSRWPILVGIVLVAVVGLAVWTVRSLPSLLNPFDGEAEQVDRSGAAVLRSIEDLSDYRAATGHFEVVVDLEEDAAGLPSFIRGERTLFVAVGTVDASVDFSGLGEDAVEISEDRRSVSLRLPEAELSDAAIDPEQSYVVARQRGLVDRLGGVFEDEPTSERQLYILAEQKLEAAATQGSLTATAEQNTRAMLDALLRSLGFTEVSVEFG